MRALVVLLALAATPALADPMTAPDRELYSRLLACLSHIAAPGCSTSQPACRAYAADWPECAAAAQTWIDSGAAARFEADRVQTRTDAEAINDAAARATLSAPL